VTSAPGRAAHDVIGSICHALSERSLPPLDERGKSIIGMQVRSLTKGGYAVELIERVAVALALSWSEARGHNALLHLAARVRAADAAAAHAEHESQKAAEREPLDPAVASLIAPTLSRPRRSHPNDGHPFTRGTRPNECDVCSAPPGCHCMLVSLGDDGDALVVSTAGGR
jgi:hypothetical protein